MKKLLTILLILFATQSFAQEHGVYQRFQIYGPQYKRIKADSALHIPTFCGVPTLLSVVKNQSAIAYDSCNAKFYVYNPKDSSWNEAGLSQSTVDSLLGGYYTRGQVDSIVAVTKSLFNGGTTGQTLVKNSNTDLDFSWSTPAGSTNSNTGSGYRLAVPFTNNIRTIFSVSPIGIDSVTNTNALTFTFDTTLIHTTAYNNAVYGSLSQQNTNTSNIASNTTAIANKTDKATILTINGISHDLSTNRSWTVSVKQEYTGSTSVTVADTTTWLIINPSSLSATLTILMPANPTDKQKVDISFGGTITTGDVVTSLIITPNTGQAILQATTPSSVQAGESIGYKYNSSNSKWYRIY